MGFYAEEIDVYSTPHQRMKDAINGFINQISLTNFEDLYDFKCLLDSLSKAFTEFEIHERIENECIIKELESKLLKLSINNSKVCDCHKDSHLKDMKRMFEKGLNINNSQLKEYSYKLKKSLNEFTETFIPHMEEEEEYFQPLLMTYFSYEELKILKKTVMSRHSLEGVTLFYGIDKTIPTTVKDIPVSDDKLSNLPQEILCLIFDKLDFKDLLRASQANHAWNKIFLNPFYWNKINPISWMKNKQSSHVNSQNFDSDYSSDSEHLMPPISQFHYNETKFLIGIIKYLLPRVGIGVKTLDLARSQKLNNYFLKKMLFLCPNIVHLDVSHTNISDVAFNNFYERPGTLANLKSINFSGCNQLTDLGLFYLSRGLHSSFPVLPPAPSGKIDGNFGDQFDETSNFAPSSLNRFLFLSKRCSSYYPDDACHTCCKNKNSKFSASTTPTKTNQKTSYHDLEAGDECCSLFYPNFPSVTCFNKNRQFAAPDPDYPVDVLLPSVIRNPLESINLSGCFNLTDRGLQFLTSDYLLHYYHYYSRRNSRIEDRSTPQRQKSGASLFPVCTLPRLRYLNLSGISSLTTLGLAYFLGYCDRNILLPENIYYCDNLIPLALPPKIFGSEVSFKNTSIMDVYDDSTDFYEFILAMNEILKRSNGCQNCPTTTNTDSFSDFINTSSNDKNHLYCCRTAELLC